MYRQYLAPVPSTAQLHALKLTDKEHGALAWMMHRALKGVGMGNIEEVVDGTMLSQHAAAGVLGSLRRKGLVDVYEYSRYYRSYEVNQTGLMLLGYEDVITSEHSKAAIDAWNAARLAADDAEQIK